MPLSSSAPSLWQKKQRQCNIKVHICKSKKRFESWKKVQREAIVWVPWLTEETLRGLCLTNIVPWFSLWFLPRNPRHLRASKDPEDADAASVCTKWRKLTKGILSERGGMVWKPHVGEEGGGEGVGNQGPLRGQRPYLSLGTRNKKLDSDVHRKTRATFMLHDQYTNTHTDLNHL